MSNEKLYIYHTNDIHSDLTYWPRLANELREKRTIREENGDMVLAFDLGDASDRFNPLTEATNGQAITRLLNQGYYDAVTIGNNEGITNTKVELNQLYNEANFSVILTNLFDNETGKIPNWADPYKVYETPWGARIGVFGLTTPLYHTYDKLGWKVTNPMKQAQEFYKNHQHEADFWILLSHLGINEDRFLSKLLPIPLIIGAHTHHALHNGEIVAGTMLTGAGQFGNWLGEIVIGKEHDQMKVESVRLINTETDIDPVVNETAILQNYVNKGKKLLQKEELADIPKPFLHSWNEQNELAEITLDAIADFAGTDVVVLNAGLFMADIKSGVVTAIDLHQALPHPIRVMKCKIKGQHLVQFAKEIQRIDAKMINQPVKGFGFRGRVFGKMCLKGLSIENNEVKWLGQSIVKDKIYEVATIDYFSFLPFLNTLNAHSEQEFLFPEFLRTIVGNYLKKRFPLN